MTQNEKIQMIRFQSEMLKDYITKTTEMMCGDESEPSKAVVTNRADLDIMCKPNMSTLTTEENDKLQMYNKAVRSLSVNDIITKQVSDTYYDYDIFSKMNLIDSYNKKVKYDSDGNAINLREIIESIKNRR